MDDPIISSPFISRVYKFLYPSPIFKIFLGIVLLGIVGLGALLVFFTGGTHLSFIHLLYVPIILGGLLYGVPGGLSVALLSGFVMGPFMPSNVELNIAQPFSSWGMRILFFSIIGILSGFGASIFRSYIRELEEKFTIDPLTHLYSLGGLARIFKSKVLPSSSPVDLMVMEIFYMDEIDQAFGPKGRNELLQMIKERLKNVLPKEIDIGFIDTKSFCFVIPEHLGIHKILNVCKKELGQSYIIEKVPLFVEFHYGIARFPADGDDFYSLIRKAKVAVAKSEKFGRDQAFYDREETRKVQRNIKILHSLRQSIEQRLLSLHYQPKIDLKTNRPLGFEALARWSHPTLGRVSPADFIGLTERTLLIQPFTRWVLDESLAQAKKWHEQGLYQTVAINFSMKNFSDSRNIDFVFESLKKYDFPPHCLEIEVTENAIAQNITLASDMMHALRERGIKISIDDFGTGQSSLQYLFKLPLDILKIDRSFIVAMKENPGAAAIVRNAILLGHDLNLQVIAEGVENQEEVDLLKKFGCDAIQGFYFAPPMEVHQATDWLYGALSLKAENPHKIHTVP